jgi:hypothetical protein
MPRFDYATPLLGAPGPGYAGDVNEGLDEIRTKVVGFLQGTAASRPAPSADNQGYLYFATDSGELSYSTGTAWTANLIGGGVGGTAPFFYPTTYDPACGPAATGAVNLAAIQAACDAAATAGGGLVVPPAGVLTVNPSITLDHFVWLLLSGTTLKHGNPTVGPPPSPIILGKLRITTGTIAAGSKTLTVASATGLKKGCAVQVRGAGGPSENTITALTLALGAADTEAVVDNAVPWGTDSSRIIRCENELMTYTGHSIGTPTTLNNLVRGAFGSTAASHPAGATVRAALPLYSRIADISGTTLTLEDAAVYGVTNVSGPGVSVGALEAGVIGGRLDGARPSLAGNQVQGMRFDAAANCKFLGMDDVGCGLNGIAFGRGCVGCEVIGGESRDTGAPDAGIGFSIVIFSGSHGNTCYGRKFTGQSIAPIAVDDRSVSHTDNDAAVFGNVVEACDIDTDEQDATRWAILISGAKGNIFRANKIRRSQLPIYVVATQGNVPVPVTDNLIEGNVLEDCADVIVLAGGITQQDGECSGNVVLNNIGIGTTPRSLVAERHGAHDNKIAGNERSGIYDLLSGGRLQVLIPSEVPAGALVHDGRVLLEANGVRARPITSGATDVDGLVATTSSAGFAANALALVLALAHRPITGDPSIPLVSGGGMSGWNHHASVLFGIAGQRHRLSVHRALQASPGIAAPITITYPEIEDAVAWSVLQALGVNTSGTNGAGAIAQAPTATGTADLLNVPMAAFASGANACLAAFGHVSSEVLAPDVDFEVLASEPTVQLRLMDEWLRGPDTNPTATRVPVTLPNWGALALELVAATPTVENLVYYQHGQRFRVIGTAF